MDMILNFFSIPFLWVSFIVNFVIFFILFIIGTRLGSRYRTTGGEENGFSIGLVAISIICFAILLLSITYGICFSRFNSNREYLLVEANELESVYLQTGYLNDPERKKIRALLKDYVYLRYNVFKTGQIEEGVAEIEELHDKIWEYVENLARENPNSAMMALLLKTLNNALDFQQKRVNLSISASIPLIMWVILYFITILAIVSLGYMFGVTNTHHILICSFLILAFSAVISLILDLDHAQHGFILVDEKSLIEIIKNTYED